MKKYIIGKILSVLLLLNVAVAVAAAPRTLSQAQQIAQEQLSHLHRQKAVHGINTTPLSLQYESDACFLFGNAQGFVLVSADDRMPAVLGYGDAPLPPLEQCPDNFRWWLSCYDASLSQLSDVPYVSEQRAVSAVTVEPLLTSQWNQSAPYNNMCPMYSTTGRSATGCVATMMAQIMYYWKFPEQGIGAHSYRWCNADSTVCQTLSADFGNTRYAWNNMPDRLTTSSPSNQQEAVATLMFHCGVAVDMMYGASSSAYTTTAARSMVNCFGYDANLQQVCRNLYPLDSFQVILREELRSGRPVMYRGSSASGSHAFVCDGCNAQDYFHFNWGWGGSSDGWFLLSALNPGSQGVGGSGAGYNSDQAIIVGLQPAADNTPPAQPQMGADSIVVDKTVLPLNRTCKLSVWRLQNYGLEDFSGSVGVALYDVHSDKLVSLLAEQEYTLKSNYYRTTPMTFTVHIPSSVPAGNYRLCAVYKNKQTDYVPLLTKLPALYYVWIYVDDNTIEWYNPDATPDIRLAKPIAFPDNDKVYAGDVELQYSLGNAGGMFQGEISAFVYKGAFSRGQLNTEEITLYKNETISGVLTGKLTNTAGTYKMVLKWRLTDKDAWQTFLPEDYATLNFTLLEPIPSADGATDYTKNQLIWWIAEKKVLLHTESLLREIIVYTADGKVVGRNIYNQAHDAMVQLPSAGVYVLQIMFDGGGFVTEKISID
ncbi:MAG: thiol protease/hemagglutinin PrtT [Paludibacter sp.]|nr:thiol protease/hemagglutinin PrtT [Bacteroidales bacterium]MCM1069251.1 thiol protease/hemagglutinin PrtT [Prevotella sp.]MCM1353766.1 thiol protease/hemagglutinin PrtT [Bacteroides sp.]MCM1442166.1 thiol protease/hemagglutinin PrtT [Muribaculum sp.]MCM1482537.1 thiol protease/hemagglutinin PrtT [Paludibacter sp.]